MRFTREQASRTVYVLRVLPRGRAYRDRQGRPPLRLLAGRRPFAVENDTRASARHGLSFRLMVEQTEHDGLAASSPSCLRRPRAGGPGGSGSRRSVRCSARRSRRSSECRKSLQAPRSNTLGRLDRDGQCVQEEGEYEYASYQHGAKPESQEAHAEPISLVQPLGETAEGSEGSGSEGGIGVVPLCKTDSEGGCARETGGGGPACPPRFAVCRNYKHRHEVSRREVERVAAEERKLGQDAGCTALGFGVGLAADPVAGAGVGFLCGLL